MITVQIIHSKMRQVSESQEQTTEEDTQFTRNFEYVKYSVEFTAPKDGEEGLFESVNFPGELEEMPDMTNQDRYKGEIQQKAIIGFWKLENDNVFKCNRDFTVSNPMLRQIRDFDNTIIYQLLYPSADGKQLFFFYKEMPQPPAKYDTDTKRRDLQSLVDGFEAEEGSMEISQELELKIAYLRLDNRDELPKLEVKHSLLSKIPKTSSNRTSFDS